MTAALQWVIASGPAAGAAGYTARLLSTLLSRTAVIVDPGRASPDRRLPTVWYDDGKPPELPVVLWVRPNRDFWDQLSTYVDITPRSTREWAEAPYPVWSHSGERPFPDRERDAHCCPVDPIAASFFHASRIEEWRSRRADRHGRFPAEEAWLVRAGLIERPLVHDYAAGIAHALQLPIPAERAVSPWPEGRRYAIAFTHDTDRMAMHGPLWQEIRRAAGGLRHAGGIAAAVRRFRSRRRAQAQGGRDPYDTFECLIDLHARHGYRATFFWINATPSVRNADYAPSEPRVVRILESLRGRGHEIGLHGSYGSLEHPELLVSERNGLESASAGPVQAARQHYLRLRPSLTWKAQRAAGLHVDTTLGFAARLGFRAGLAVPFQPWDFDANRPFDIWEVPLVMMDVTAREYMRLSPDEAVARSQRIIGRIAEVGGAASVLWHNSSLDDVDWPGWGRVYESWLGEASSGNGWGATISEIVAAWKEHVARLGNSVPDSPAEAKIH